MLNSKADIYDTLCTVLYQHENGDYKDEIETIQDMYDILCIIQRNWETVITAQE